MTIISHLTSLNSCIQGNTKPFKNEKDFTAWFLKEIRKRGGFGFKISDYDLGYKPCDAIIAIQGESCLAEIKYTKYGSCQPYKMLRGSSPTKVGRQVEGLGLYERNGGKSLVIVYSAKSNTFIVISFAELAPETKIEFTP